MLTDRPELVPELIGYLSFYAGFARSQGMVFIYELISYELAELAEVAYAQHSENADGLLDAMLALEGIERHAGLVKSRLIMAACLAELGEEAALARVMASLQAVPAELLQTARADILKTEESTFWEINHRGTNFDYVSEPRRALIRELAITA